MEIAIAIITGVLLGVRVLCHFHDVARARKQKAHATDQDQTP